MLSLIDNKLLTLSDLLFNLLSLNSSCVLRAVGKEGEKGRERGREGERERGREGGKEGRRKGEGPEFEGSDRDILQDDVVVGSSLDQPLTDIVGDSLPLCDQLISIELSNNGLQNLISNGRKDTLSIVQPNVGVNPRKFLNLRLVKKTDSQLDGLQILGGGLGLVTEGGDTGFVDDGPLLLCLVCFGLFWFGLVWFGLVWFGLVWFGLV